MKAVFTKDTRQGDRVCVVGNTDAKQLGNTVISQYLYELYYGDTGYEIRPEWLVLRRDSEVIDAIDLTSSAVRLVPFTALTVKDEVPDAVACAPIETAQLRRLRNYLPVAVYLSEHKDE